jgi:hypothetical protein
MANESLLNAWMTSDQPVHEMPAVVPMIAAMPERITVEEGARRAAADKTNHPVTLETIIAASWQPSTAA